eukprot:12054102-Alexandrium_andersonii.AAC.1
MAILDPDPGPIVDVRAFDPNSIPIPGAPLLRSCPMFKVPGLFAVSELAVCGLLAGIHARKRGPQDGVGCSPCPAVRGS